MFRVHHRVHTAVAAEAGSAHAFHCASSKRTDFAFGADRAAFATMVGVRSKAHALSVAAHLVGAAVGIGLSGGRVVKRTAGANEEYEEEVK